MFFNNQHGKVINYNPMFQGSRWCRWLSRLSNTQTVSSSSLERDNFFCKCTVFIRLILNEIRWLSSYGLRVQINFYCPT